MREMGIEAIYPHKNTSKPDKEHIIYPEYKGDAHLYYIR
jgi:hypothetical protein